MERLQIETSLAVLGDGGRYRIELMVNPYSTSQLDSDARRAVPATTNTFDVVAVLGSVIACVASASAVWWALQRIYNTVDPVYENTSVVAAVVAAFVVSVLGVCVRFLMHVRGQRLTIIAAVISLLAASLALWSTFFLV